MSPSAESKPVIGLVGGIGSGKSTATEAFAGLGCAVIDADKVGHEVIESPEVLDALRARWGEEVFAPDGRVSRESLGRIVFAHPGELETLNGIMHPRIRECLERRIAEARARAQARGVVLDAAVLFEAGWDDLCTHVVYVHAPASLRYARVERSRGWDEQTWRARENCQIPLDRKREQCYAVLDNSSGVSHLSTQVRDLFHTIVHGVEDS